MATTKKIDLAKLTDQELIALAVRLRKEVQARGIEAEAEVWASGLADGEKTRIAQAAAEAEAAKMREAEQRRLAAEAAAKARRDAEAAATAAAWADKERIGARVREILGEEVLVKIDYSAQASRLSRVRRDLKEARDDHGRWAIGDLILRFDTEEEARNNRAKVTYGGEVKRLDFTGRIAELEAEAARLEAEIVGPTHRRKPQSYRLEVWSRGGDVRVYIARVGAKFGDSLFDYFCTGNGKHAPGSYMAIFEEIDEAAAARGVGRSEIEDQLGALCAELGTRYTSLKIDRC